jgi:hypothetical protein
MGFRGPRSHQSQGRQAVDPLPPGVSPRSNVSMMRMHPPQHGHREVSVSAATSIVLLAACATSPSLASRDLTG